MGKFKYITKYNRDWENPELFPNLADDVHHYTCKVCNTGRLKLSKMGVTAPRSHTNDGKVKICKQPEHAAIECDENGLF